jgi:cobalamin biosynthesis Mg chelatase CobN
MRKVLLIGLLSFLFADVYAQANTDSIAYQAQRKKINSMLAVRTQKFGQYDNSLSEHTGIFGLQTKKDIRRSNDILMDIVKTDNDIYKQLKILLDYRTFQQTQVQDKSKETENTSLGFMYTINKLQAQVEKLKKQQDASDKLQDKTSRNFTIIVVILLVIILMLLRNQIRAKEGH